MKQWKEKRPPKRNKERKKKTCDQHDMNSLNILNEKKNERRKHSFFIYCIYVYFYFRVSFTHITIDIIIIIVSVCVRCHCLLQTKNWTFLLFYSNHKWFIIQKVNMLNIHKFYFGSVLLSLFLALSENV